MNGGRFTPVVVKLGGSLIALPDLAQRLQAFIHRLSPQRILIVVGGGAAADEIRRLDALCGLTASRSHWAAIAAMSLNARVISRVCGPLRVVADRQEADAAWVKDTAVLLDSNAFLAAEPAGMVPPMPEDWSVTSDSIAGFITLNWPASELVFCKACNLLPGSSALFRTSTCAGDLAEKIPPKDGLDDWFSNLVGPLQRASIRLSWVNLTDSQCLPARFYQQH